MRPINCSGASDYLVQVEGGYLVRVENDQPISIVGELFSVLKTHVLLFVFKAVGEYLVHG